MQYVNGNIFDHISKYNGKILIPHIVNTHNSFGSGFAYHVSKYVPHVKDEYHKFCYGKTERYLFGTTQYVDTNIGTFCNMFAQTLGGPRPLRYNHLVTCMTKVATQSLVSSKDIHTVKFGSGLAGGDWNFIEDLIEDIWENNNIKVYIYVI